VTLPSSYTGGELMVEHNEERKAYRGSKTALSLVAFYADCRHEVLKVTSGYRIAVQRVTTEPSPNWRTSSASTSARRCPAPRRAGSGNLSHGRSAEVIFSRTDRDACHPVKGCGRPPAAKGRYRLIAAVLRRVCCSSGSSTRLMGARDGLRARALPEPREIPLFLRSRR
jgi:hypothetical protein